MINNMYETSIKETGNPFPQKEISYGTIEKLPIILLADVSGSMHMYIKAVEDAVKAMVVKVKDIDYIQASLLLKVASFGSSYKSLTDFEAPGDINKNDLSLEINGCTNMYMALTKAADELEDMKNNIKQQAGKYVRPYVFVFTDGCPTDVDNGVAQRYTQWMKEKKVSLVFITSQHEMDDGVLADFGGAANIYSSEFHIESEILNEITKLIEVKSKSISMNVYNPDDSIEINYDKNRASVKVSDDNRGIFRI